MSESEPEVESGEAAPAEETATDGEPGTVAAEELGVPGDVEPMPEDESDGDDAPDELGADADDTTDDAPVEIDQDAAEEPAPETPGA